MEEDLNEVLKSAEQIGYIVGKYGTQKEKDLLSVLLSDWQEVRTTNKELEEKAAELCRKNAEQQKMIELMADKIYKTTDTLNMLDIGKEINYDLEKLFNGIDDTEAIKIIIDYFRKKAKGE